MWYSLPTLAFGFGSPLLLWGLALGSIPIIIHLLHRRQYETEIGIPGHKGFGKDNQLGAFIGGLGDSVQHPLDSACARCEVGRNLDGGGSDGSGHG